MLFNLSGRVFFILLISALTAFGQSGNIRGFVYEKESGEPVIFTKVVLEGTTYGAVTDVNGYFSITKVEGGNYTILISYLGYDTLRQDLSIKKSEIITQKFFLQKGVVKIKDIEISADRKQAQTDVRTSVTKITPKEIRQIPAVGGEPDLAQYLQVLPGVVFTGDQGGQLYIRGGAPIQNKVLLDGAVIYNPFHSIGLFSVFDADIIRNADVYTGGFGAQYGGRISSVMDITTRDGNKKRLAGKVGISPFGARTMLEGPLGKKQGEEGSNGSFLFSAKNSYLAQTSKVLYNYIDTAGLPFNFLDLYGKVSFNTNNGSKFNLFGFNFRDNVRYRGVSDLNWNSYGGGSNFIVVPTGSQVLIRGNFAYSDYKITLQEDNVSRPRDSRINGFNMGLNFTYFIRKNELNYGVEILGFKTDFNFFNNNIAVNQRESTTELAGYFRYKILLGKLVIDPSFRAHYYASLSNFSPEPRLGLKYNVTDRLRLKFAGGFYSQNLISANSDRDVVNLFYGFLSGPENLQKTFRDENGNVRDINHKLQKATHAIAGLEFDINDYISLNVEPYLKQFTQLTNINRNKLFEDTGENSFRPDSLKKDFIIETGRARGIDFLLKYDHKKLYVWAVYSLGYVSRWDGSRTYWPHFDRRHNVNLVVSYVFGKGLNWEIDGRWNFGSGFPFTRTQGFFEFQDFQNGLNTDYLNQNGQLGILYGPLNDSRLPTYHRFDIAIKRKFPLGENGLIEVNAGATNIYNRQNIFFINRVTNQTLYQLPFLPSFGMSWNF
ncbi:MAG: hypothetical protein RLZZ46_842 [Bacteroidota bacterium]